jgi:hypothetical protein
MSDSNDRIQIGVECNSRVCCDISVYAYSECAAVVFNIRESHELETVFLVSEDAGSRIILRPEEKLQPNVRYTVLCKWGECDCICQFPKDFLISSECYTDGNLNESPPLRRSWWPWEDPPALVVFAEGQQGGKGCVEGCWLHEKSVSMDAMSSGADLRDRSDCLLNTECGAQNQLRRRHREIW